MHQEYVVRWSGGRIGSGATVLNFKSVASNAAAQTIANSTRTLFDSIKAYLPDEVSLTFDSEVLEKTEQDVMTASYPVSSPATVQGTSATSWQNGAGLMVRHNTGVILGGRRIYGRTFIVPAASGSFGLTGDVLPAAATAIQGAFNTFRTQVSGVGADHSVFSKANEAIVGITSSIVSSRPTYLSTRNDRL